MLVEHRREQLELRMKLGLGKATADALVFCNHDGSPISKIWRLAIAGMQDFPKVSFHSLRHSHASALIAAGIDVVKVSRRLGLARRSSP
jgi:integrase